MQLGNNHRKRSIDEKVDDADLNPDIFEVKPGKLKVLE